MALLTAFGIVIPLSLAVPMYLVQALDVRNTAFIFAMAGTGPLTSFHCFEGTLSLFQLDEPYLIHISQIITVFEWLHRSTLWNESTFLRNRPMALPCIPHIRRRVERQQDDWEARQSFEERNPDED
jgi:hypothetical protein